MTGPLASLAVVPAERIVNALLAADPFAARRLRRFSGRTVALRTRSPAFDLTVHFGEGAVRLAAADAGAPDAAVTGDARALAGLLLRPAGRRPLVDPDIAVSGDAMLVQDLAVALGSLDADWGDLLAPLLGDAASPAGGRGHPPRRRRLPAGRGRMLPPRRRIGALQDGAGRAASAHRPRAGPDAAARGPARRAARLSAGAAAGIPPGAILAARRSAGRAVSLLPRLFRILNIVAKHRLHEFLDGRPGAAGVRLLLLPFLAARMFRPRSDAPRHRRLRLAMEELGPITIKFGQLLSTRRDFLDSELADELRSLQDDVPPFDSPPVADIVADALGRPAGEVFLELSDAPLASASVAQVHAAVLPGGEEVVVKVLRPGVEDAVAEDLRLMKWLARAVESRAPAGRRLRPVEVVDDYEKVILDELDLRVEAANTSQLRRNFEGSPALRVPKVHWEYTRRNLLVLDRVRGLPVNDVDAIRARGIDLKALAETGVDIFFTQVFEHNFFHADMHPGNILVAPDETETPRYIALDCAIIGSLDRDDQEYLARNLLAVFKRDYRRVAELHVAGGWVPAATPVRELESAMRRVCEPIFEKPLKDISFGRLLAQLFHAAGRFDMEVQPSLVLLQKTMLNIEGLGRQLYPELDLWRTALPYLEEWNRRRLDPLALLSRTRDLLRERLPEWAERLPDLPLLLLESAARGERLREADAARRRERLAERDAARRRRAKDRAGGAAALLLALAALMPGGAAAPLAAAGLGLAGAYLLFFRR